MPVFRAGSALFCASEQAEPEGYLFAATWLLFGPPVMACSPDSDRCREDVTQGGSMHSSAEASADVLLDLDLAGLADQVGPLRLPRDLTHSGSMR